MDRFLFFSQGGKFNDYIRYLHTDIRSIGTELEELRISLEAAYISFEACLVEKDAMAYIKDFSRNPLNNIHDVFISKFKEIWTKYAANDTKLIRLYGLKREHSATKDSPEVKRYKQDDEYMEIQNANFGSGILGQY
ncbi:hypothetical protein APHAL10511_008447 [Amanita phalloides]|nr:hypothetical protein APHAL10511_008447 [Amanita phalloides]